MLPAINEISSKQTKPTTKTNDKATMLMDYTYTRPESKIRYHVSDMKLYIDSDVAYLVIPKARSRGVEHFYMGDLLANTKTIPKPKTTDLYS